LEMQNGVFSPQTAGWGLGWCGSCGIDVGLMGFLSI
jgi:hypothetical protein